MAKTTVALKKTVKELPKEEKKLVDGKCKQCKKPLTAFVVSNSEKFCSDLCVSEFLG